jgi:hypothetical protein
MPPRPTMMPYGGSEDGSPRGSTGAWLPQALARQERALLVREAEATFGCIGAWGRAGDGATGLRLTHYLETWRWSAREDMVSVGHAFGVGVSADRMASAMDSTLSQ